LALLKTISGIRGTIGAQEGEYLSPEVIVKYTAAFVSLMKAQSPHLAPKIVVGCDARLSGPYINRLVCGTIQAMGIDVVDLDLSTTPTVEIAVPHQQAIGGIILTASHNPIQWNALKLLNAQGEFINAQLGQQVLDLGDAGVFAYADARHLGQYQRNDSYIDLHIAQILASPLVNKKAIESKNFKIAVDAVNSTGGIAVPKLLKALGVKQITQINCEATGYFAHNPEPLPENLTEIMDKMAKEQHDLGIIVDPDVDRLAFIADDASYFGEEYTLVAIADYVLQHQPGNTVSNLSSTRALRDITLKHGGKYQASAVGEVNVVNLMKATNAVIGGEGNGGVIFPELHYGRDSLIGIALFLSHLASSGMSSSRLRGSYPNYHISKNKIDLAPKTDIDAILKAIEKKYAKQQINTIDGLKIDFENEWVHLRKSNTEPIIRIYCESESESTANYLANKIISDIKELL
jgi:phosphomannomutase